MDVANEESIKYPRLSRRTLINNSSVLKTANLEHTTKANLMKYFEVNAVGPLLAMRAFLPHLQAAVTKCGAAIVANVSSRAGSIGDNISGGSYGYRASTAALNIINKSLTHDRKEYKSRA